MVAMSTVMDFDESLNEFVHLEIHVYHFSFKSDHFEQSEVMTSLGPSWIFYERIVEEITRVTMNLHVKFRPNRTMLGEVRIWHTEAILKIVDLDLKNGTIFKMARGTCLPIFIRIRTL